MSRNMLNLSKSMMLASYLRQRAKDDTITKVGSSDELALEATAALKFKVTSANIRSGCRALGIQPPGARQSASHRVLEKRVDALEANMTRLQGAIDRLLQRV